MFLISFCPFFRVCVAVALMLSHFLVEQQQEFRGCLWSTSFPDLLFIFTCCLPPVQKQNSLIRKPEWKLWQPSFLTDNSSQISVFLIGQNPSAFFSTRSCHTHEHRHVCCLLKSYFFTWLVERMNWLLVRYVSSQKMSGFSMLSSFAVLKSPRRWLSIAIPVIAWKMCLA